MSLPTSVKEILEQQTISREEMFSRLGLPEPFKARPRDEFTLKYESFVDAPQRVMQGPPKRPEPQVLDMTDHSYLRNVHHPEKLVELASEYLKGVEYDTLVGTGLSGVMAVTAMARLMDKNYLVVRKPNDGTHSAQKVEGKLGKRWVFVDDLIDSGWTFARVWDAVHEGTTQRSFTTTFVGSFLYGDGRWYDPQYIEADVRSHERWLENNSAYRQGDEPSW